MKLSVVLPLVFALFAASENANRNCWGDGKCQQHGCQLEVLKKKIYGKKGGLFKIWKEGTELACCGDGEERLCAYTEKDMSMTDVTGALVNLLELGCRRCGQYDGLIIKA
ncbi:hypothetical protein GX50_07533 [[Emmonsia] crescens]|uniref:Killer toxin Kp4 domain-containing protein n=1 Tax=[Emmonsia] crescens TaxID=73230 RepID=A0A2B7Z922_9EURO|nr:hypothetical protein GX50_07533 [Emmonsia crescens]